MSPGVARGVVHRGHRAPCSTPRSRAARGRSASRCCAAAARRGFPPRPARIRRRAALLAAASLWPQRALRDELLRGRDLRDDHRLEREKNSVATSNSPASNIAISFLRDGLGVGEAELLAHGAKVDMRSTMLAIVARSCRGPSCRRCRS
jgi:hypothetical protein